MTKINTKVTYFEKVDEYNWATTGSDVYYKWGTLNVNKPVAKSKGSFSFVVSRTTGMAMGNRVRIYQWLGTSSVNTSTDLLIDGVVNSKPQVVSPDRTDVKVAGVSFVDILFNAQVYMDTSGVNSIEATQEIVSKVNELAGGASDRWIYGQDQSEWDAIGNPNSAGQNEDITFPEFTYIRKYTSAKELLDEVWSDKFTSDGQYIWYVEWDNSLQKNKLIIQRKSSTPSGTMITEGGLENNWNINKKIDKVINVVYFNCGNDAYGNAIEPFTYDVTSMQEHGPRTIYWSETSEIANHIIQVEKNNNASSFNIDSAGNFTSDHFPTGYPYTMSFNTRSDAGAVGTGSWSVSSDAEFNAAIRKEAKWQGQEQIQRIINMRSNPRFELDTLFPVSATSSNYGLTTLYQVTSPSYGLTEYKLRCINKEYTDWDISYEFEEDEINVG